MVQTQGLVFAVRSIGPLPASQLHRPDHVVDVSCALLFAHYHSTDWPQSMSTQAASSFILSFPWDIERLIFEEAARDDRQTALRLAFVSRNVQSWSVDCSTRSYTHSNIFQCRVEPIIYKVVTLNSARIKDAFLRSLEITTKPTSFYTQCIKALYLPFHTIQEFWGDGIETAIKILPYCKGVEYFVCWISPKSVNIWLADVV